MAEGLFEEILAGNGPNLGKETDIKIQESQRTPIKINKSRPTPSHIKVKFSKYRDKEKILKAGKTKEVPKLQGKTNQVSSRSLHRNLASKMKVV